MKAPTGLHLARRQARLRPVASRVIVGLATLSVAVLPAQVASATTQTVTNCNDSGAGSLRQAVASASPKSRVTFDLSPACSVITLTSGAIEAATSLTIKGPGASILAVSGNDASRVLQIDADASVSISGLTVENGDGAATLDNGAGGGILNEGALTLEHSMVSDNSGNGVYGGTGLNGSGGGIASLGSLNVTDSTITGNQSYGSGGGIYNGSGKLTIVRSTVGSNAGASGGGSGRNGEYSDLFGGGIYNGGTLTMTSSTLSGNNSGPTAGGGIYNVGSLMITSSTLVGNNATAGGAGIDTAGGSATVINSTIIGNENNFYGFGTNGGGGILSNETVTISNSTILFNGAYDNNATGAGVGGDIDGGGTLTASIVGDNLSGGDCAGSLSDHGYNIDDDGTCGFSSPSVSNSSTLDSTLGSLADNGGPTETAALKPGNPAIDLVPSADCPATDQRGVQRTAPCDIGAYDTDGNPTISKITPARGGVGTTVNIKGTHLSGATAVGFNGTAAKIKTDSGSSLTTRVPAGATTGPISITTSVGGTVTSKGTFKVT